MKAIWKEFFYVPKYGKIREKVILTRGVMTIVVVLMCLAAMGFSAYAYFSDGVSSQITTIQTAKFDLNVTVADSGATREPIEGEEKTYSLPAGTYTVTLTRTDDSTATTGFCEVEIIIGEDKTTLYTAQINAENSPLTFTLVISNEVTVKFAPKWGSAAASQIANGETVTLPAAQEGTS